METMVKDRRQENPEKGEDEMKTLIEKQQVKRDALETMAEQQTPKVVAPKPGIAETVPGRAKKETVSEEVAPNKGLCATCNEAAHCAYAKNATSPILFCEMFDESKPEEQVSVNTPPAQASPEGEKKPASLIKGLCVNCEHRDTCNFPKPEGGVWHCEEYR